MKQSASMSYRHLRLCIATFLWATVPVSDAPATQIWPQVCFGHGTNSKKRLADDLKNFDIKDESLAEDRSTIFEIKSRSDTDGAIYVSIPKFDSAPLETIVRTSGSGDTLITIGTRFSAHFVFTWVPSDWVGKAQEIEITTYDPLTQLLYDTIVRDAKNSSWWWPFSEGRSVRFGPPRAFGRTVVGLRHMSLSDLSTCFEASRTAQ